MVESLPTGRAYVRRILVYTAAYALLASGVISLYLSGLLRMGPEQWRCFFEVVAWRLALISAGAPANSCTGSTTERSSKCHVIGRPG